MIDCDDDLETIGENEAFEDVQAERVDDYGCRDCGPSEPAFCTCNDQDRY
jgi:hypothetical protein